MGETEEEQRSGGRKYRQATVQPWSLFSVSDARRPPSRCATPSAARASSMTPSGTRLSSLSCSWARIGLVRWTCACASREEDVSQMYAVRQAIAKAVVAYYQKYVDEATKAEV